MAKASSSDKKKVAVEADTSSSRGDTLICVVCGDKANGMHYRALTCEGCKTFFRRNARNHLNLKCEMGGEKRCEMDLYTRRHCAACRMKKCLDKGMQIERLWDKERIKTRKPITKKTAIPPAAATAAIVEAKPAPPPEKKPAEVVTPALKEEDCENAATPEEARMSSAELAEIVTNAYMTAVSQPIPPQPKLAPSTTIPPGTATSEVVTLPQTTAQNSRVGADVPGSVYDTPPSSSLETSPGNWSLSPLGNTPGSSNSLGGSPMGAMSTRFNTLTEGLSFHDLPDGFQEISPELFLHGLDILLGILKHMINFAKALPLFLDLSTEDQATLVKGSFLEYLIISSGSLYDPETHTFKSELWPGDDWDEEKIQSLGFKKIIGSVVDVAVKICKLNLTRTELTLLYAISIFNPERKDLCNTKVVEDIQHDMIQALRFTIDKTHKSDSVGHFAKVIMLLTDVKNVTEVFLEDVMSIQLQGAIFSPIMMEMFSD